MDKLLDAFALVTSRTAHAKLLIIGDGSALPELKDQARDLGLQQRVIFTGFVPYQKVPSYL
ncbi:MAG TPA: glycosyltransferase, partial [Rhodocyclaceae bacterium]|nr:glycosyltransferase [Rhodocyclaceae bacterium]